MAMRNAHHGLFPVYFLILLAIILCWMLFPATRSEAAEPYVSWVSKDYAIQKPLGGLKGDARRGRKLVASKSKGNCLACHVMPITEESFYGNIGPSLAGVAGRLNEGELRLRVVNQQLVNPNTIMPGFYKDPKKINQILDEFYGTTFLTAQEVEDVVAFLKTLK